MGGLWLSGFEQTSWIQQWVEIKSFANGNLVALRPEKYNNMWLGTGVSTCCNCTTGPRMTPHHIVGYLVTWVSFLAHQPNYSISFLNLFEIPDFMDLTSFDNNGLQEYLAEMVNRAIDMSIHSHIFQHAHRTRVLFKPWVQSFNGFLKPIPER